MENQIEEKYKQDVESLDTGVQLPENSTVAQEAQGIVTDIKTAVKKEITEDPENRGYAGKSAEEIATLINDPICAEDGSITSLARTSIILAGIPYAPNALTAEDITKALE